MYEIFSSDLPLGSNTKFGFFPEKKSATTVDDIEYIETGISHEPGIRDPFVFITRGNSLLTN